MTSLTRISLEDGGFVLVEDPSVRAGPVKAGRIGDAMRELPGTLQMSLEPVTEVARVALQQLRRVGPDAITVEFGVNLAVEAGAVITKSRADGHLKVTVSWQREAIGPPPSGNEG